MKKAPRSDISRHPAKKDVVAILLASGLTVTGAAEKADVSRRTIQRWLLDADYRRTISARRNELSDAAVGRLSDGAATAATVLLLLLADRNSSIRLRAAVAVFRSLVRLRETGELANRVLELEIRLREGSQNP